MVVDLDLLLGSRLGLQGLVAVLPRRYPPANSEINCPGLDLGAV